MWRLTPHQRDIIDAIKAVPVGTEFRSGDLAKHYGYPHKDASKVLQQDIILSTFVSYAPEEYKNNAIHYVKSKDFDLWFKLATT